LKHNFLFFTDTVIKDIKMCRETNEQAYNGVIKGEPHNNIFRI